MTPQKKYKVGDKLVEPGNVYKIFKIKKQKNGEGKTENLVYFKPFFKEMNSTDIICSIPEDNITEPAFRQPATPKYFNECISQLKKRVVNTESLDISNLKDLLKLNDLTEVVRVINILLYERSNAESFPKSKKDVIEDAISTLALEYAIINGVSLETAKEKLTQTVNGK